MCPEVPKLFKARALWTFAWQPITFYFFVVAVSLMIGIFGINVSAGGLR